MEKDMLTDEQIANLRECADYNYVIVDCDGEPLVWSEGCSDEGLPVIFGGIDDALLFLNEETEDRDGLTIIKVSEYCERKGINAEEIMRIA